MCDTRSGRNGSLVINLGLAYPKILESMKGGKRETINNRLFDLLLICVAWSSQSNIARGFSFPGWVGAGLEGQKISLGSELWACSSCIPESGRHWCGPRVEKPPCWLGSLQGISSPLSAAFSPCLMPMSTMEVQSPWLRHARPSPSAKRFPAAGPWARTRGGQEGHLPPPTSHRHMPGVRPRPLLPQGGHSHGHIPPFRFQTPLLPVAPRSCVSGTGIPLCCRKPWFGILGGGSRGTGAPQGAALAAGAGP